MAPRHPSLHPVAAARRATRQRVEGIEDGGFTLIELMIVVVILPIVVGGIAAALLSVFGLQDQTTSRIGDSNDALVGSVNFNRDVQSAEEITTQASPVACPNTNEGQETQLMGLEWGGNTSAPGGFDNVVSYVSIPVVNAQTDQTTYTMLRQICSYTSGNALTLTNTFTVSHDVGTPVVTITGANNADITAQFATWHATQGVTGVTFKITEPGSGFSYSLVGLPGQSTSQSSATSFNTPSGPGCGFSTSTGTVPSQLCFADFTGYSFASANHALGKCQTFSRPIANTPYTLTFCLSVSANNVAPASIPTYYNPSGYNSEAFLGNNGFFTGIPGDPALYQNVNGALTTAYMTNIQVLDAAGQPATGWTLVTGDAESTDSNEWMVFQNQSSLNWTVLNNSAGNPFGNACYDGGDDVGGGASNQNIGFLAYTSQTPPTTSPLATGLKASLPLTGYSFPTRGPFWCCVNPISSSTRPAP